MTPQNFERLSAHREGQFRLQWSGGSSHSQPLPGEPSMTRQANELAIRRGSGIEGYSSQTQPENAPYEVKTRRKPHIALVQ